MTRTSERARPGLWWFGLLGLLLVQVGLIVRSIVQEISHQPADPWSVIARAVPVPAGFILLLTLTAALMPLLYRRSRALARTVRTDPELTLLSMVQVTRNVVRTLTSLHDAVDHQPEYTAGQAALWRMALVDRGDGFALYDGSSEVRVVLEVPYSSVSGARSAIIDDGYGSTRFHGLVIEFEHGGKDRQIDVLPVGRGPGGAFPQGKRFSERLVVLLRARQADAARSVQQG